MKPIRVQLSRKKGWRLPPNTVVVSRPSRWGNPWPVGKPGPDGDIFGTAQEAADAYSMRIGTGGEMPKEHEIWEKLNGKNLACWCKLGTPCHADYLLEIANP